MRIKVKNIGPIVSADIKIDGLTVLTGINATGKSMINKALYSVLFSASKSYQERESYYNNLKRNISINLLRIKELIMDKQDNDYMELVTLINKLNNFGDSIKLLKDIRNLLTHDNKIFTDTKALLDLYLKSNKAEDNFKLLFKAILSKEIKNIKNYYFIKEFSSIELDDDVNHIEYSIDNDNQENYVLNINEIMSNYKVLYFDNPRFMDNGLSKQYQLLLTNILEPDSRTINKDDYNYLLLTQLLKEKQDSDNLFRLIDGELTTQNDNISFKENNHNIDMINVASGYKLLSVLQTLYTKDYLDYNTILLLDEPEVHMHPELMLDFAEFLLKLINENLVKIVITTHSPLLIEALKYQQIKIKKYDNALIRYYELSGKIGENKAHDKTNRIEDIYERFNKPFYNMEED